MEYLEIMKTIQDRILEFLDNDYNNYYQNADDLATFLISPQAKPDKHDLRSILRLISKITKNHHRCINYYDKIKKLINIYQKEIKQTFSNIDIFNIFKKNKLLILLLIEEEIITINEEILEIMDQNYKKFFYPEIQKIQQNEQESKEIPTDFYLKRRSGENDSYICELIRNDNDIDFISFINKNNISINMEIQDSIFETNSFLLKHKPTLIEYSAFFGSIKIFDYLRMNGANLNQILHLYAIHGNNAEINLILEESKIERDDSIYDDCFKESVKCHHNEFALYYKNNFNIKIYDNSNYLKNEISFGFRFSNFKYIPNELTEPFCFFYAVDYDYYKLVALKLAFERNNIDIYNYLLQLPNIQIGNNCFKGCTELTKLSIPPSCKAIGNYAFCDCKNLTEIIIPSSVTSIGKYAFCNCKKLTELNVPSSVTSIGDSIVAGCTLMRKIIIPQNVINIGILEFHNFSLLQEFIIPKSSTSIKDKEFYKCKSLVKVEIPPSVTNIGEYAFYECVSLKNITIPSSVKTIGFNAFNKCSSLKNIKISPLPKNFDVYTFSICTSFMQNFQIPSFHIDKDTIILDGTYHDVELPSSIENTKFNKIKLMVVGESCVGKTRYITKYINENDEFSFITKMFQESIKVDFNISGKSILLDILDTPGFEKFKSIYERFYSNINCAIFMFDLTDIETLKPFQYCFEHLYRVFGQIPIVLVGNKCDLEDKKISTEEINEIVNQYDVKFFEVSVKNNLNIKESMNYTVGEAFRKIYFDNAELLKASEKEKSVENKCNIS